MWNPSINRFSWFAFIAAFCFIFLASFGYAADDKIAVLIDPTLYNNVSVKFNRYISDVEANFPVDLIVYHSTNWESESPENIRNFLITVYYSNGIKGALLVGQIPYALWEQSNTSDFGVSGVYYEDMDGSFSDTDYDGLYDWHTFGTNEGPEIWVCWMRPPEYNQAYYLDNYLDKVHDYYTGTTTISARAFAAFMEDYDNNWEDSSLAVKPWLENIYGASQVDTDGVGSDLTYDTDINNRLNTMDYEIVDTWQHAGSWYQGWDSGYTQYGNACTFAKGPLMIFIYGCHSGDFHESSGCYGCNTNIVVAYAFGDSVCQAGSGTSWGYGTEYKYMIYDRLDSGDYLGKAWFGMESYVETKTFVQNRYPDRTPEKECAGNNLIGNPFLVTGFTPAVDPTPTLTPTPTPTPTSTPTSTPTPTPTSTPTSTPTPTPTSTLTPTPTGTDGTCSPATPITIPFSYTGSGTFCWETSDLGNYINSWNLQLLEVNGVNLTNMWVHSSSLPDKIGGMYYVYYVSGAPWGHFEAKY